MFFLFFYPMLAKSYLIYLFHLFVFPVLPHGTKKFNRQSICAKYTIFDPVFLHNKNLLFSRIPLAFPSAKRFFVVAFNFLCKPLLFQSPYRFRLFPFSFFLSPSPGKPFLNIFGGSVFWSWKPTLLPSAFPTVSSPLQALSPCLEISSGNRILPPESPVPFSYNSLIQNFFLPLLFFLAKCVILKARTNVRIGTPWKFPEHESWSFAVSSFYFIPLVQFYKEVPLLRRNTHEHLSLL